MTLKLQVGKTYRSKDGQVVTQLVARLDGDEPRYLGVYRRDGRDHSDSWLETGALWAGEDTTSDLVTEIGATWDVVVHIVRATGGFQAVVAEPGNPVDGSLGSSPVRVAVEASALETSPSPSPARPRRSAAGRASRAKRSAAT